MEIQLSPQQKCGENADGLFSHQWNLAVQNRKVVTQPSLLGQLLLSPGSIIVCDQNYHNAVQTAIAFSNLKTDYFGIYLLPTIYTTHSRKKNESEPSTL